MEYIESLHEPRGIWVLARYFYIRLELTFFSMTLAQTEKGYPPPIEHVGVPQTVRAEKGRQISPFWNKKNVENC